MEPLAAGSVIEGRYRLDSLLGEGAFGAVYRASRLSDGAAFALKVLHDEVAQDGDARARLRREATALSALAHPNVLSVAELGQDARGHLFLVTEFLHGETLDARLARGPAPIDGWLGLIDQVLGGLSFAHAMGVTHRDLKPANIFLVERPGQEPLVKLLDFGLAKFQEPGAWGHHTLLTKKGALLGTPDYMAPEQIFGPSVDARSDVYAAGIVLFEIVTGATPFTGEELTDIFRAHVAEVPPSLGSRLSGRRVTPELEALVARALGKAPDARFRDARAMRTALSRLPKAALE